MDQDGRTAFHWAMKIPNIHCLKWLCKYANITEVVNQPVSSESSCKKKTESFILFISGQRWFGSPALGGHE